MNNTGKLSFSTASFYTSFLPYTKDDGPFGNRRRFLQSSLLKPIGKKSDEKNPSNAVAKNTVQQAIYILPKPPSHVSIYLQLAKFRSLSVLMRCGHVSQLVENWLCDPMEQLKRKARKNHTYSTLNPQPSRSHRGSSSPLCIMPSSSSSTATSEAGSLFVASHENALTPSCKPLHSIFVHFQLPHEQQEHVEIRYTNVPCLFTVVCVTYRCGTVSLSVNQIDSLDFLLLPGTMNSFLVQCNLVPQHPITVHQLVSSPSSIHHQRLQISDFENNVPQQKHNLAQGHLQHYSISNPEPRIKELLCGSAETVMEKQGADYQKSLAETPVVELLHYKETLLYQQEDDDEESVGMFTSDEDFSLIDEDDMTEEDYTYRAKSALLDLVQNTLQYIESNGGALTDELNNLVPRLYDYCSL
ncbi:hypothetical protein [Parasitella parasitica]|uniref:Uncharacterized protein n=1 Tax=Parasitella parasitica TaxID=35722 RepID=A0A0B7MXP2_9FUNG|nr:hypothetical protein [Parasitella parasitica]